MNGVKKHDLPQKICVVCQRPFTWRKKWAKVWAEVKYCSEACRKNRRRVINGQMRLSYIELTIISKRW